MATYKQLIELSRKRKENSANEISGSGALSATDNAPTSINNSTSRFNRLLTQSRTQRVKEYEKERKENAESNNARLKAWFSNAQNEFESADSFLANTSYNDMLNKRDTIDRALSSTNAQTAWVEAYLKKYEGTEDGEPIINAFKEYKSILDDYGKKAKLQQEYANSFDNENEYNNALREAKYANYSYDDLQKELNNFDNKSEDYKWLTEKSNEVASSDELQSELKSMQEKLDSLQSEYKDLLKSSNQDHTTAERKAITDRLDYIEKERPALQKEIESKQRLVNAKINSEKENQYNNTMLEKYGNFSYEQLFAEADKFDEASDESKWLKSAGYSKATSEELQSEYDNLTDEFNSLYDSRDEENRYTRLKEIEKKQEELKNQISKKKQEERVAEFNNLDKETRDIISAKGNINYWSPANWLWFKDENTKNAERDFDNLNMSEEDKNKYLETYNRIVESRSAEHNLKMIQNQAENHPFIASALSVANNTLGSVADGFKYMGASIDRANGGDGYINPDSTNVAKAQTARETVSRNMDSLGSFLYNTGMSMADFTALLPLNLVPGGQAGSLAIMGTSSGVSSANTVIQNGGDINSAINTGLAAGIAEAFFEKFSLGELKALKTKSTDSIKKAVLKNAFTEGSEEVGTDIANAITDRIINGDMSQLSQQYQSYIQQGYSEDEAWKMCAVDFGKQVGESFLGGALSGGVLSSGTIGLNYATGKITRNSEIGKSIKENNNVNSLVETAKKLSPDSKAYKVASQLEEQQKNNKNISSSKVGRLRDLIIEQSTAEYDEQYKKVTENLHENEKAVVDKLIKGESLNSDEISILKDNDVLKNSIADLKNKRLDSFESEVKANISAFTSIDDDTDKIDESKLNVSDNGKTKINDNEYDGSMEIVRTNPLSGTVTYRIEKDGKALEVNSDDIQFKSKSDAKLNALASKYNVRTAQSFFDLYESGQDIDEYSREFNIYQNYGRLAVPLDSEKLNVGYLLDNDQKMGAYEAGLTSRKSYYQEQNIISSNAKNSKYYAYTEGKFNASAIKGIQLNETQRAFYNFFREFALRTGINIELFSSEEKSGKYQGEQGSWNKDTKTVRIDINAGLMSVKDRREIKHGMLNTFSHELTHIAENSGFYEELHSAIVSALEKNGSDFNELVKAKKDELRSKNPSMGEDRLTYLADVEVIANTCETMLKNSKIFEDIAQGNSTLAQKLKSKLKDFIQRLKQLLNKTNALTTEGKLLEECVTDLEKIQKLWDKAVTDGIKTANAIQAEQKNNTVQKYEQYQLRGYSDKQIDNWSNSKNIIIYRTDSQLSIFIDDALAGKNLNQKMYFGTIDKKLANRIYNDTNVNVEGFNVVLRASEIRKILLHSHGNEAKENARGQRAITKEDILLIPNIISEPDKIVNAGQTKSNKPAIAFEKTIKGKTTVLSYVSDKHMDLTVQTMYSGKEKSLPTTADAKSPASTPETNSGTASNNSIFNATENVNNDTKKFSIGIPNSGADDNIEYQQRYVEPATTALEERLQGDELLDAQDIIDTIKSVGGKVDEYGNAILYHGTNKDSRDSIYQSGKMTAKEDGLFFSTKPDGEIKGYGDNIVRTKIPAEYLELNDIFNDEAHFRLPLDSDYSADVSSVLFQMRPDNGFANRRLLANALENSVQNEYEKKLINLYKNNIDRIDELEARLDDIKKKIKKASSVKAAERNREQRTELMKLNNVKKILQDKIIRKDKQLLNLESMEPMKKLVESEKKKAAHEARSSTKATLKEVRENRDKLIVAEREKRKTMVKGVRNARDKREIIRKINKYIKDIDKLLNRSKADKTVKQGLRDTASKLISLSDILLDTSLSNADIVRRGAKTATPEEQKLLKEYLSIIGETDTELSEAQKSKIYKLNSELKNLFIRERERLNRATVHQALTELSEAYKSTQNAPEAYIRNDFDSNIIEAIDNFKQEIGGTLVKDMSVNQVQRLYEIVTMIRTKLSHANKLFAEDMKLTCEQTSTDIMNEIQNIRGSKELRNVLVKFISDFQWRNLKPVYAFRYIGSKTFEKLFWNLQKGELNWYTNIAEAKQFKEDCEKKYGYRSFDFKKTAEFKSADGSTFTLDLNQMMDIYAASRRPQALQHLLKGGFTYEKNSADNRLKVKTGAKAYPLTLDTIQSISDELSENEKNYAEAMQKYLSEVMAKKGNEVSMALYGVEMFNEDIYWSISSSDTFLQVEENETTGEFKVKNFSFTKATIRNASNPIVLKGFEENWCNHVNQMSLYHAMTLPLEDFTKVFNYNTGVRTNDENPTSVTGVRSVIKGSFGNSAEHYFRQLLRDLNGGIREASRVGIADNMIALSKKAAVFANLSVVFQQPSAIFRAMAYVDKKFFLPESNKLVRLQNHRKDWEQLKKYAPIAGIKEMGMFDTGTGKGVLEWLSSGERDSKVKKAQNIVDNIGSKLPALADEYAWVKLWHAIQRETRSRYGLAIGTEENLVKSGERFNEVVHMTQVYDSVFSRSGAMRSSQTFDKMATSFMAEPTTIMNMAVDAVVQFKRNGKSGVKMFAKSASAILVSIFANTLLKSIVSAGRDDEDKPYDEKYWQAFRADLLSFGGSLNPLNYYPIMRDLMSVIEGYTTERMDMSLVSDFVISIKKLMKEDGATADNIVDFVGYISNLFGIPVRNVVRDFKAVFNTYNTLTTASKDPITSLEMSIPTDYQESYEKYWSEGYTEEDCDKKAQTSVKSKIRNKLRPVYIEALKNQDSATVANIRRYMRDSGFYKSLNDVDEVLKGWRKSSDEEDKRAKRAEERK